MATLSVALLEDHKLHSAPEIIIEVLSPGVSNEQRDRQAKLKLHSRLGVREYWIVNGQKYEVEIYRHDGTCLRFSRALRAEDRLESPLLPGFSCLVSKLFFHPPQKA